MIRLANVSHWYGSVVSLSDVSLELREGIIGLLGPNGAGKSSMMKLMTGQMRARSGSVTIDGGAPWRNGAVLSRVGFAPEGDVFYGRLSGLQFVRSLRGFSG